MNKNLVDTTNCAREPIHVPGRIQAHGFFIAISKHQFTVQHVSTNIDALIGLKHEALLGQNLADVDLFKSLFNEKFKAALDFANYGALNPTTIAFMTFGSKTAYDVVVHENNNLIFLEFEKASKPQMTVAESARGEFLSDTAADETSLADLYKQINSGLTKISQAQSLLEVASVTAKVVKEISNFDRVMIYQFDESWNGKVIAEEKMPDLEAYLGLQYPASDIPAQARALYERNWTRVIPDVHYEPSDIVPALGAGTSGPLDLSFSILRSVSPVHIQYLKNMGVGASASVSIILNGKLWGLISLHHQKPQYIRYEKLRALELIGKFLSAEVAAHLKTGNAALKIALKGKLENLVSQMKTQPNFLDGLHFYPLSFIDLFNGVTGGAIIYRGKIKVFGKTPKTEEILNLSNWLSRRTDKTPIFQTAALSASYPAAENFKNLASGLLAMTIPEPETSHLMWFKPEVLQTVNWGGNPNKPVESAGDVMRLSPRKSFSLWQEEVRGQSLPFEPEEIDAAESLRRSLIEIDLERQVGIAIESNAELDHFAGLISHELKAPLRGISAFATFIKEDLGAMLKGAPQQNLMGIIELSEQCKYLIQRIFEYSKISKINMSFSETDLNQSLASVCVRLQSFLAERHAKIHVPRPLPTLFCDSVRVSEIFANLISNAAKYNDHYEKNIEVGYDSAGEGHYVFYVRDDGIGIKSENFERIFKMFERLHTADQYGGGSGAGLAIVKKIIDRHGGKTWVESEFRKGATFYFTFHSQPEGSNET